MNYRKVPFMGLGNYNVDFAGEPFLANRGGIAPVNANTYEAHMDHDEKGRPLGDYDAMFPGAGFAGLPTRTVVLRPRKDAAPGWPGFFGWLAATHPQLYNYARVSLPNYVEDRQGISSAGSQLGTFSRSQTYGGGIVNLGTIGPNRGGNFAGIRQ